MSVAAGLVAAIVVVAVLAGVWVSSGRAAELESAEMAAAPTPQLRVEEAREVLTRDQIRARLAALREREPPEPIMGAMCYRPAMPPERLESVCADCGERTIHSAEKDWEARRLFRELTFCRRLVKEIRELDLALDESAFCRQCSPQTDKLQIGLIVRHADGTVTRTRPVRAVDLQYIQEFLAGKIVHDGPGREACALRDRAERLEELLGLRPAAAKDE